MSLDRLRQLVPPPANPVETGTPDLWAETEAALGTRLPEDYKQLIDAYGAGEFANYVYLYTPAHRHGRGNLVWERHHPDGLLALYMDQRTIRPELVWPSYPEPGGVLPLGQSSGGHELFWLTEGDPDHWPVLLTELGVYEEVHRHSVTEVLVGVLTGELDTHILEGLSEGPHDFWLFPAAQSPRVPAPAPPHPPWVRRVLPWAGYLRR